MSHRGNNTEEMSAHVRVHRRICCWCECVGSHGVAKERACVGAHAAMVLVCVCMYVVCMYVCMYVLRESVRVYAQRIAKELPCVLTVRDVGKVSALLSFQLRSSTTPARDLPSPLSLLFPLSLPLPSASTSSCSFSYSATEGRLPLANVSSARFLRSTLLSFPLPMSRVGILERWMVLVHHSHPMVTDTPESSQPVDVLSRKREEKSERKRGRVG